MKVGDLVKNKGNGQGFGRAIGIIAKKRAEYGMYEVLELCGEYVGTTEVIDTTNTYLQHGWYVISEMSLTDDDHPDTLQG